MRQGACIAAAAWLAMPVPAIAQDTDAFPLVSQLKALETDVPARDWYPEGYYDLRIAAEAEMAETSHADSAATEESDESHNLIACDAERIAPDTPDPLLARYGDIAMETARLRAELTGLRYPADIYTAPLLAFEREQIAAADGGGSSIDPYTALAEALETARAGLEPAPNPVFAYDLCRPEPGAGPKGPPAPPDRPTGSSRPPRISFRTDPPNGELLMINAFAFKVCMRRQADPWDRFACRWNEIETGVASPMIGRFVYQIRWPDGTMRKGTREIAPTSRGITKVTFRKTGS